MTENLSVLLPSNHDYQLADSLLTTLLKEGSRDFGALLISHRLQLFDTLDQKFLVQGAAFSLPLKHRLDDLHVELPEVLVLDLCFALDVQDYHEEFEHFQ